MIRDGGSRGSCRMLVASPLPGPVLFHPAQVPVPFLLSPFSSQPQGKQDFTLRFIGNRIYSEIYI